METARNTAFRVAKPGIKACSNCSKMYPMAQSAPKGLIARIKKHPELLDQITEHQQVVELVDILQIAIEPINVDLLKRAAVISRSCRLLTNDSLTLAVMEKLGVTQNCHQ